MSARTAVPGTLRERSALILGCASAALLALAALAPFSDPDLAGRAALSQSAGRIADGVLAEWQRIERDLPAHVADASALLHWNPALNAPAALPPPQYAYPPADLGQQASDALLAESERVELVAKDLPLALELAGEALAKTKDPLRAAEARLRRLQLFAKQDARDALGTELAQALSEIDPKLRTHGMPYVFMCALLALPMIDAEAGSKACAALADASDPARCAPPTLMAVLHGSTESSVPSAPRIEYVPAERDAWLRELAQACPALAPRLALVQETAEAELAAHELGRAPERPSDERWRIERCADGNYFAWHAADNGRIEGCFASRDALETALARAAREHELLPGDFAIDFGETPALGLLVRERTSLASADLGFTLRHPDPESLVRRSARASNLVRLALFAMALVSLAAGFIAFRALRRERLLSELKSAFVANVSHELRTPLASILLLAENLETGRVTGEAERARYHGLIRREALRLRRLVDDVLDFSRLERGMELDLRFEELELGPWLEQLGLELAEWAREQSLELAIDMAPLAGRARLDPEALRRALLNLLDNARKHSGSRSIGFKALRAGTRLVLAVEDDGIGIPPGERERIFEPFARLDEGKTPGTGLGLAIVREIAEAHGGSVVALAGTNGRGARIEIRLPLAEPSPSASQSAGEVTVDTIGEAT